jgi:hypothetical protein
MITKIDLEIVPGVKGEPLFKSQEEYEAFRKSFHDDVAPELEKLEEARRRSIEDLFKYPLLKLAS